MIYDTSHHDDVQDDDDAASNCGFDDFDVVGNPGGEGRTGKKKSATLSVSSSGSSSSNSSDSDSASSTSDNNDAAYPKRRGSQKRRDSNSWSSRSSSSGRSAKHFHTNELSSSSHRRQLTSATIEDLRQEALFLLERFRHYYADHSATVSGLGKLLTRFEKEASLATDASSAAHRHTSGGGRGETTAAAGCRNQPLSEKSYLQCNCLRLLELVLHVLENEPEVVAVVHPIKPRVLARSAARPNGAALPDTPFDVDVISCGGLRWVKVKGTSRRNLDAEIFSSSSSFGGERRSLPLILRNMACGARCTRLPFGMHPQISLVFFYRPSRAAMRVLAKETNVEKVERRQQRQSEEKPRSTSTSLDSNGQSPGLLFSVHIYEDALRTLQQSGCSATTVPAVNEEEEVSNDENRSCCEPLDDTTSSSSPAPAACSSVTSLSGRFDPRTTPSLWSSFLPTLSYPIILVNFDVTALVALVSDTCNGWAGSPIPGHPILNEQSRAELTCPAVRDFIEPLLEKHTRPLESLSALHSLLNKTVFSKQRGKSREATRDGAGDDEHVGDEAPPRVDADIVRGVALDEESCAHLLLDPLAPAAAEDGFLDVTTTKLTFTSTSKYLRQPSSSHQSAPPRCNWIVSDVALAEFMWILSTIAGPCEYQRAVAMLRKMYVVSSLCVEALAREGGSSEVSAVIKMQCTGKITQRHKDVFGLGDYLHAITLSANRQFSQAARDQGVEILMATHPSRALTERKRLGSDRMSGPKKPPATTQLRPALPPTQRESLS